MKKRVFALGFFDGVHLGHQQLLKACCRLAEELDCQAASITFDRHPQSLFTDRPPLLINTAQDRQRLLRRYGIGPVYQLPVVPEVMGMPWRDFLKDLLEYGAAGFVCGYDFRFGHRGEGNAEKLREACAGIGIPCVVIPELDEDGVRVSSTYIREQIEAGQMERANRFLGHPHILTGTVVPGRHLGHKLGFPTANVPIPPDVVCPKHGVYACRAFIDGREYPAVTNVGSRPTVNGHQVRAESWILDLDEDLYGREITLAFHAALREERRFGSLEELKAAVILDAQQTREFFGKSEKV